MVESAFLDPATGPLQVGPGRIAPQEQRLREVRDSLIDLPHMEEQGAARAAKESGTRV